MLLLIDNYDSFTYNLFQLVSQLAEEPTVIRNDQITVTEVRELAPAGIIISPGPGRPPAAGISVELVRQLGRSVPILGICLGHECIGEAFGASITPAPELMHGKSSSVFHDAQGVFAGLPNPLAAIRYHSLAVDESSIPEGLDITARTESGTIMGLRHRTHPVEGVQFHPESIMTPEGPRMVKNWLRQYELLAS